MSGPDILFPILMVLVIFGLTPKFKKYYQAYLKKVGYWNVALWVIILITLDIYLIQSQMPYEAGFISVVVKWYIFAIVNIVIISLIVLSYLAVKNMQGGK